MEEMLGLMDEYFANEKTVDRQNQDHLTALYGEVEEVIHRIDGTQVIKVDNFGQNPTVHKDWISAGWLSGRTFH